MAWPATFALVVLTRRVEVSIDENWSALRFRRTEFIRIFKRDTSHEMLKYCTGLLVTCLYVTLMAACQVSPLTNPGGRPDSAKIKFRLDDINSVGLRGPAEGLVSVAYEFCVPANEQVYQDLRRIDASLQINPGANGRSGCTHDQALAIGNTGQPGWHDVLEALSLLDYVAEIHECFFE